MRNFFLALIALFAGGAALAASDHSWPIDVVVGKPDAPITIIEYSSLTCPHCAKFQADAMPRLKKEWLDTGKAKLILRDYVWDPLAQAGAMIAHCSGDRYAAFIDTYFHSQATWKDSPQPLDALKGIARLGGMSGEEVDKCIHDKALLDQIMARKDEAEKVYAIESTPTFVVNGKVAFSGYGDISDYEKLAKILADQKVK